MQDTLWHSKPLLRTELDSSALEIDYELSFHDIKEFILIVMLMPMELTLQDAKPDNTIIDLA